MILVESIDIVFKRIKTRRREYARLTHATSDHLAPAPRPGDESILATQNRPGRRAQPFRKTDGHRVEMLTNRCDRTLSRDGRIESPRLDEMHGKARLSREHCDLCEISF